MGAWFHRRGHSTSGREEGSGNVFIEMGAWFHRRGHRGRRGQGTWFHRDGGLVS